MLVLDGHLFRQMMVGGANGVRTHIDTINALNVFPVPDGDTGTNMSRTIDSAVAKIAEDTTSLGEAADAFAKGALFGARGNSGVILSQFFAGLCSTFAAKSEANVEEVALAYLAGVKRAYEAVATPVEGTILTVFRESAEFAKASINKDSTLEDFLSLHIQEAARSLARTKEILPVLIEADVVDSGGAGYLAIAQGMYDALTGKVDAAALTFTQASHTADEVNYDLFGASDTLLYGYCTECLVRLQHAKCDIAAFDEKAFAAELEALGCDSIVSLKDGDILKLHAHTKTPQVILALAQKYGEFLNVKIENMTLQHSERVASESKSTPKSQYGVVTVATGDGLHALFTDLGANYIIDGGQTGNPSAEQFLEAFCAVNANEIVVLPNNSNILLTARQAAELWEGGNVTVIPTKTLPQGYAVLSVFNAALPTLEEQLDDLTDAMEAVSSGEVTVAIRDTTIADVVIEKGDHIGLLDGKLVASAHNALDAISAVIDLTPDLDFKEMLTLFVGKAVTDEERVYVTQALEEKYPDLTLTVYVGGQEVWDYLLALE